MSSLQSFWHRSSSSDGFRRVGCLGSAAVAIFGGEYGRFRESSWFGAFGEPDRRRREAASTDGACRRRLWSDVSRRFFLPRWFFFLPNCFFLIFFACGFFFGSERVGISRGMLGLGPLRLGSFRSHSWSAVFFFEGEVVSLLRHLQVIRLFWENSNGGECFVLLAVSLYH